MAVRRKIPEYDGAYFITITCADWLHIIEEVDGYDIVYKWFDYLKGQGHYIFGYVIMPNHFHCMIAFTNTSRKSINSIIANGKRFMAYEFVKRLKARRKHGVLMKLKSMVNETDYSKGQRHRVFEPSFDWKECYSNKFLDQKINYMHLNPCRGVWKLVSQPEDYVHSSARFYILGEQGIYPVTSYGMLDDIDLTVRKKPGNF